MISIGIAKLSEDSFLLSTKTDCRANIDVEGQTVVVDATADVEIRMEVNEDGVNFTSGETLGWDDIIKAIEFNIRNFPNTRTQFQEIAERVRQAAATPVRN